MTPLNITPDEKLKNYFDFQNTVYEPIDAGNYKATSILNIPSTNLSPLMGRRYTEKETETPIETVANEVENTEISSTTGESILEVTNKYSNIDPLGQLKKPDNNYTPTPTTGSLFDLAKRGIGGAESTNDYSAHRWDTGKGGKKGSGAWGKYQFIGSIHSPDIKKITGKNLQQFLESPEDQERFFEWHFSNTLLPELERIKKNSPTRGLTDLELISALHFAGYKNLKKALDDDSLNKKLDNNPSIRQHINRVLKFVNT